MSHRKPKTTDQSPVTNSPDGGDTVVADLASIQAELETLRQGWQRTQADFDNFRRRTQAEQQDRTTTGIGQALVPLTSIAENLRRALGELDKLTGDVSTVEALRSWASGVGAIARQLDQALSAAGLTPIDPPPGSPFNPHEHEALTHQPHSDYGYDTIVQVIERGYRAGDRVLIPAKVIVSSGKSTQNE